MELNLYGDDSKGLIRLDPRTKLLIFLSSSFLSLHSFQLSVLVVFGTVLCALFALSGKPWTALKAWLLFAFVCYVRYVVEHSIAPATFVEYLVTGVVSIFLFGFPVVVSFLLLAQTTRISHFLTAFQAMRLPSVIVIPIAVLFRFVPAVQEEWTGIRKAMAFRGIELNPSGVLRSPMKAIEHLLIPLLFSTVSVMEELAAAALARGMDSGKTRTSYETVKLRAVDYVVIVLFLVLSVFIIRYGKAGYLS